MPLMMAYGGLWREFCAALCVRDPGFRPPYHCALGALGSVPLFALRQLPFLPVVTVPFP